MTLDKLLHLSEPLLSHLENKVGSCTCLHSVVMMLTADMCTMPDMLLVLPQLSGITDF